MLKDIIYKRLTQSPIIFSVKDEESFKEALTSPYDILFLLFGDISNIEDHVAEAKNYNKIVFVHLDLINGMASHESAVEFISQYTLADGIISTKPRILKQARKYNLTSILRIFMLDSMAMENGLNNLKQCQPDLIEILPGIATKIIPYFKEKSKLPVIAGGFIRTNDDVMEAIKAGASGVSTTCPELIDLDRK